MMTQHPDAASRYVSIQEEPNEAIEALSRQPKGLGLEEVMIDFEGKLTPYQQTSQITLGLLSKGIIPGKDVFVTPRIPSGIEEGVFRQLMALMSIVESNYYTLKEASVYGTREIILPMTTSAEELLDLKNRIIDVIELAHKEFKMGSAPDILQTIPLLETMPPILLIDKILTQYQKGSKRLKVPLKQLRVMLGRSDLALTYGMIPSVLAVKLAISDCYQVAFKLGINVFPIVGGGTLPFRGNFTLENLDNTLAEYAGTMTYTVQSAMRYDHGSTRTINLAKLIKAKIKKQKPLNYSQDERLQIFNWIGIFSKAYLRAFKDIIKPVALISDLAPKQRDRLARKSEVGYARDIPHPEQLIDFITDKQVAKELSNLKLKSYELPRAISYTAALYSIGVPPEIIGTGRGLMELKKRYGQKAIDTLLKVYPSLGVDLATAGRYYYLENAADFLPSKVIKKIKDDAIAIENIFNIKFGPQTKEERFYRTIMETMKPMLRQVVGYEGQDIVGEEDLSVNLVKEWIVKLGSIRGALG